MAPGRLSSTLAAAVCLAFLLAAMSRGERAFLPAFLLSLSLSWALASRGSGRPWRDHPGPWVFLASLAFYLSTFRWHGGDDLPTILLPFAILRHGTLALDAYVDPWMTGVNGWYTVVWKGRHLSLYPPAHALLSLPLYIPAWLSGAELSATLLKSLSKLSGALLTAASVGVFWNSVSARCSRAWALNLCLLYGLGSWAFSVSSQAMWQHGPAQLAVALGLWGLGRDGLPWDRLAGFGFVLAVSIRPDSAFFAAAGFAFVLLGQRRRLSGLLQGALPVVLLTAAYWLHYTGRLLPPEAEIQRSFLTRFHPGTFLALLASPTRGLLPFFPAAAFGVWGALSSKNRLDRLLLAACAAQLVLVASYDGWVGGGTFGSRYLAVVGMVLAWLCAGVEEKVRSSPVLLTAWCATLCFCLVVHAIGAYWPHWPGPPDLAGQKATAWDWGLHPLPFLLSDARGLGPLPLSLRACVLAALLAALPAGTLALRRGLLSSPSR